MIERPDEGSVGTFLEEVTKGHPVLLNRAPHAAPFVRGRRSSPQLIEGESESAFIRLVCTAYNADFDGDQDGRSRCRCRSRRSWKRAC